MAESSEKLVLTVNFAPSYLMPRPTQQLRSSYPGAIRFKAVAIDSEAALEARADRSEVVAVIVSLDDKPDDLTLLKGVIRKNLAEAYAVSGQGSKRNVRQLRSLEDVETLRKQLSKPQ